MRQVRVLILAMILGFGLLAFPGNARADITIWVVQNGSDVVSSTSGGTLNLSGLRFLINETMYNQIYPSYNLVSVGSGNITVFDGAISLAKSIGNGGQSFASSTQGPPFTIISYGTFGEIGVASDALIGTLAYVDAGSSTWAGESLHGLGLVMGSYTYFLPNDTITVDVVPEPTSLALLAAGAPCMLLVRHIRRRKLVSC